MFPTYPTFTEGRHTAEFLKSEAEGYRSRENITVASGSGVLMPGTVLGRITSGAATAAAKAGNAGNGTISAVTTGTNVQPGVYRVEFTAATKFVVVDPDGEEVGQGSTGVAFAGPLGFTITAGGTPFASGDGFDITIAAGSGKYVPTDLAAVNGSAQAAAVLYHRVDATSVDVLAAAIARDAEVYGARLVYHASVDQPGEVAAKVAELKALGIIVR
ncbi:head decoration protein [Methylobacterium nodulans]|uniref:Head decoration protein n=1 Tax=Methylobacterium nodulans (strain LMG 21967 / CNCM I-2342 / ORS 2060) TaxID=460265 RepID=B8ICL8_METNO|nr:head decoration protein [Methylobacterium nodulans]ACL57429.1 conserved hypothetical protein [Methylobacterium nodulans ORS 2060]